MSFIENSIRNYCVNYFNFKGRTGRAEFWTVTLILVVVSTLLQILFNLLTFIPSMSMTMRRANDSNLSKITVILYYVFSFLILILAILVSFVLYIAGNFFGLLLASRFISFSILFAIIAIILWLIIACRKTREIPSSTKDSAAHFATDFTTDSSMDSNSNSTTDRDNINQ